MRQLGIVMEKVFHIIFVFFSAALVICSLHGAGNFNKNLFWNISCLIVILFFFSIVCYVLNLPKEPTRGERVFNVVGIFALSLCIHLLVAWWLGGCTAQISDFADAFALSKREFPLLETPDHYRIFSNWDIYPLYLKFIQVMFGYGEFTGIICNALLCAFSSTLIYILGILEFDNQHVGYLAAMIYTFWPSHLLYLIILTPEFVNVFLVLLFFCCLQIVFRSHHKRYHYVMLCLSAAVLSLSGFFKSIDKIILIAFAIILALSFCRDKSLNVKIQSKKKALLVILLFIGSYILSNKLIFAGLDYAYGEAVNRDPSAHFIYIGLNSKTVGTWNEEVGGLYKNNVIDCDYDYKQASALTYQQLKKEVDENRHLTFTYFKKKFEIAWENNAEAWWTIETIKDESLYLKKTSWLNTMNMLTQIFWIVICLCVCAEAVFLFIRSNSHIMCVCLILFGFACLMIISEVQGRYKCVMYPTLSILAADGVMKVITLFKCIARKWRWHMGPIKRTPEAANARKDD